MDRIAAPIKTVAAKRAVPGVEHNLSVVENLCDSEILAAGDYARLGERRRDSGLHGVEP